MFDLEKFRVAPASKPDLDAIDPHDKAGFDGEKSDGKEALKNLNKSISSLQRRLWAESAQKLLVVLQAIDTGGKDGTIRHVFSGVNPQGVKIAAFGKPTDEELARDFLWRVHQQVPANGEITVFNRSHYEDVLVVRVKGLVPAETWEKRYRHINEFERMLVDEGTTIVKIFLHISKEEQRERLQARLDNPDKNWKFHKSDLDDRELWDEYRSAYEAMLEETSTEYAPWYVVPADRKWYRNLVVASVIISTLEDMDPQFPEPEKGIEGIVVE
jgi:PPK2 family polyphosphate:nucleotide phosphotransferase